MANYVFKQFCGELDQSSLDHLLEIVAKPMDTEQDMLLEADSEEESQDGDEDDDSDVEEVEAGDSSDDNDEEEEDL